MCWNEKTSWTTFIIGTVANIFNIYYFRNTVLTCVSLIWQWVLFMQLFDAMAWRSKKTGDESLNKFAANGAMIANVMQPIVVAFLLLISSPSEKRNKNIALLLVFIYMCWLLYSLNNNKSFEKLDKAENCSNLDYVWWKKFPGGATLYMIILLSVVFLLLRPMNLAVFQSGYIVLTLILSALIYSCGTASVWCWFAAFAPVVTGVWWKYNMVK